LNIRSGRRRTDRSENLYFKQSAVAQLGLCFVRHVHSNPTAQKEILFLLLQHLFNGFG
jgi:hypothetical protein